MAPETARFDSALSERSSWSADECPAGKAMELIGTRSAILILREAYFGTTRFDDFVARAGVTDAITAARLRTMVEAGLLERRPYREPGKRLRYEYVLTRMGRDLSPVVLGLYRWGAKYLCEDGIPPVTLTHGDCGAPVRIWVTCEAGHPVPLGEVVLSAKG